jgi:methylated-DNA-[protein]-cysteine S-methyltransferase
MTMKMIVSDLESPLGTMLLATDEQRRVRALEFAERRSRLRRNLREQYGESQLIEGPAPTAVANALQRYFAGALEALDSIEVATAGTELQERAWAALRRIPAGQTTTYGELGKSVGINDWRAAVDTGAAVGANPIAVIVPCHRVLGVNGDLKGYAWGLHRKRWLLEHEAAIEARPAMAQTALLF